jgi:hypothetical protein
MNCICCSCLTSEDRLLCCPYCTGEACLVHGDEPCGCDSARRHAELAADAEPEFALRGEIHAG